MAQAVIVAYGRSAVGKAPRGYFKTTHPVDLGGQVLEGVLKKLPQLNPLEIDEVIYGCSFPVHMQTYDIAKMIALRAGLPSEVPGITVSRFCSSSLDAITMAAEKILSDQADIVIAGGIESMSLTPKREKVTENEWLNKEIKDAYLPVGLAGENTAYQWNITKEEMAQAAEDSHKKAAAAIAQGRFDSQIIPVTITDEEGNKLTIDKDQGVRPDTTAKAIDALTPAFGENGLLNAGTSSQRSDGSGCIVLMSDTKAKERGITPIARFVGSASGSGSPSVLLPGLEHAINKVMKRCNMESQQMDVIELNEAFASVYLAAIKTFCLEAEKVNPNGGAMALGHPLGATGAILTCKLLAELSRTGGRYGLVTMCVAAGQGCAAIFEQL